MGVAASHWVITGAAGTIGQAVRAALHERGVRLTSTDVRPFTPLGPDERTSRIDLSDFDALTAEFAEANGVIYLGGIPDEEDFHDLAEVNIVGTYHVLEAARRAGVPRVVYASSNRLTGMYPSAATVSPDLPARPDGFYGVSKVAGEALCQLYSDKFGMTTVSVRIGSYEERPSSPREQRTWLSPGDAIRAFLAAMTTSATSSVFYAVSRNEERWWDLEAGAAIGFEPEDNAIDHEQPEPFAPDQPQGGEYTSAMYSIKRMRRWWQPAVVRRTRSSSSYG